MKPRKWISVVVLCLMACGASTEVSQPAPDAATPPAPRATCPLLAEVAVDSPRPDLEAEMLAMEASKKVAAPDDVYARIVRDLSEIRAKFVGVVGIRARPNWVVESAFRLRVDGETIAALRAGTFHAWDCTNERFGMTAWREIESPYTIPWIELEFGGRRLDYPRLYAEYSVIAGVSREKTWNVPVGDGDDICALMNGSELAYVFKKGGGDCPSGCNEHVYWGFIANAGVDVVELGSYDDTSGTQAPPWYATRREACRTYL